MIASLWTMGRVVIKIVALYAGWRSSRLGKQVDTADEKRTEAEYELSLARAALARLKPPGDKPPTAEYKTLEKRCSRLGAHESQAAKVGKTLEPKWEKWSKKHDKLKSASARMSEYRGKKLPYLAGAIDVAAVLAIVHWVSGIDPEPLLKAILAIVSRVSVL
jgi:hypothetical protein